MPKQSLPINLTLIVTSVLLACLASESAFRLRRNYMERNDIRQPLRHILPCTARQDCINIYFFGDSTMYGYPYNEFLSIPALVDFMLDHKINGKPIAFYNLSQPGKDFKYCSDQLTFLLSRKEQYHPDLCVIYSGHNEFLKYHPDLGTQKRSKGAGLCRMILSFSKLLDRLAAFVSDFTLQVDNRRLFDEPLFEDQQYDRVLTDFCTQFAHAVTLLKENRVPLIISTAASNYSDWEPNRSLYSGPSEGQAQIADLINQGKTAEHHKLLDQALTHYLRALQISNRFAESHYRLANTYRALGRFDDAWHAYQEALDHDGMPIRARSTQNDCISHLTDNSLIFCVDAVSYLRRHTDNGLLGYNLMSDAHHPNIAGYVLLSRLIVYKIKEIFRDAKPIRCIGERDVLNSPDTTPQKMFRADIAVGRWFTRLSTWRFDPEDRLAHAQAAFNEALALDKFQFESYLGLAMIDFLRGDTSEGEHHLSQARHLDDIGVRAYLRAHWTKSVIQRAYTFRRNSR